MKDKFELTPMDLKAYVKEIMISTVQLPDGMYETMIYNTKTKEWWEFQKRYSTRDSAVTGHFKTTTLVNLSGYGA